jgi:sterol desaturase/sphingolipid hydroxylase (fatty acid hydroxylase superfamily)
MHPIWSWMTEIAAQPRVHAVLHALYNFFLPPFLWAPRDAHDSNQTLPIVTLQNLERVVQSYIWFLLMGLVIYALMVISQKVRQQRYAYKLLGDQVPGKAFSLREALTYLLPKSFYRHQSVKIDAMYWPLGVILGFYGLFTQTLGVGVVASWLQHHLGHSPLHLTTGISAIVLQVGVIWLARDFGHFMWHWQGHFIPFFWEFHKGHHSAEVLHPIFIRMHPVDRFIRQTYIGSAGGLIGGSVIYLLGMQVSIVALSWIAGFNAAMGMLGWYEHCHLRISFGKTLSRIFFAPYMHHVHHGALLQHMNKNLGVTGGLLLWDYMFRTFYAMSPGEQIIWGASMQELGENNPHKTFWGFLTRPFIAAAQVLRGRPTGSVVVPVAPNRVG